MADQDLAPGQVRETALRDGGFTDNEVDQWKSQTADTLTQGGFSGKEVRDYFGTKEPDMTATKDLVTANFKKAVATPQADGTKPKREPIDASPKPVEAQDMLDVLAAGFGQSTIGTIMNQGASPIALKQDVSVGEGAKQSVVAQAAQLVGDAPLMFAGSLVGGAPGAFAIPAAMRKLLTDHYEKGDLKDASDFAQRAIGTTWEAAKAAGVGYAASIAGPLGKLGGGVAGKYVAGALGESLLGTTAQLATESAAMTTASAALEGHLPNYHDFINNAVAVGGLHAIGFGAGKVDYVAKKMMGIYSETGARPEQVTQVIDTDPSFKGEVLSDNQNVPVKINDLKTGDIVDRNNEPIPEIKAEEPPPKEKEQSEAQKEILSRIGEETEPEKTPLLERAKDKAAEIYANKLDKTAAVGAILKEIGDQPLDENNAQVLMRIHAAVDQKIQEQIEKNTYDWDKKTPNGEGVLSPVFEYQDATGDTNLDRFKAYGIAQRSLELELRGIDSPGSRENDRAFVEANQDIKPYFDRFVAAKNRVLDYLAGSGRYSKEAVEAMKDLNQQHISFKRILEEDPVTGKSPISGKSIKEIAGNEDLKFQDPIASTVRDIGNMIKLAHETEAANTFIDGTLEDDSPFIKVSDDQSGAPSDSQIAGYVDGERTLYDVPPEAALALKGMAGNKPAVTLLTNIMKPFAAILRATTVNNPLFALRHAWRNQLTAATLSQTGLKPFEAILYAPEFFDKSDKYRQFLYDGGGIQSIIPNAQDYVDGTIYKLNNEAPFLSKAWNALKTVAGFSHMMITANDNIIRFSEYSRMLDSGASRVEAAFAAREVLPDFQKSGLQQSALSSITPFLNVHLQGMSRMVQETATNPASYIVKNLAYITVPSLLLYAAQHDDDAVNDLPNWQKYNYWIYHAANWRPANSLAEAMSVKDAYPSNTRQMPDGKWQVNDGTMYRIQKPFTNGVLFGSFIEASLDSWKKKDPGAFKDFISNIVGSTLAEPIPAAVTPAIEQYTNRNFYTGESLVRQSMENKLPEMQYDRYTSETAKILGKALSYVPGVRDIGPKDAKLDSPQVIENYIHGWGGSLGTYMVDAVDKGLEVAGIVPDKIKPIDRLSDIPFVKEFTVRFPSAKPQSIMDFDERYKQADEVHNSITAALKQGDFQTAMRLQDRYSVNMDRLTGIDKALQNLNSAIQKTYQASDIEPVQKRQLIDTMMYQMTSMAKHGNELMDAFEKVAKTKRAGNN